MIESLLSAGILMALTAHSRKLGRLERACRLLRFRFDPAGDGGLEWQFSRWRGRNRLGQQIPPRDANENRRRRYAKRLAKQHDAQGVGFNSEKYTVRIPGW